jgi:hypothetical protein
MADNVIINAAAAILPAIMLTHPDSAFTNSLTVFSADHRQSHTRGNSRRRIRIFAAGK